jgi:hypothetical protein
LQYFTWGAAVAWRQINENRKDPWLGSGLGYFFVKIIKAKTDLNLTV